MIKEAANRTKSLSLSFSPSLTKNIQTISVKVNAAGLLFSFSKKKRGNGDKGTEQKVTAQGRTMFMMIKENNKDLLFFFSLKKKIAREERESSYSHASDIKKIGNIIEGRIFLIFSLG